MLTICLPQDFEEVVKEIKFLKSCNSSYLTNILGAYFAQQNRVWIIMDFCLGSVYDALQAFKQPLLEPEIKAITWNTVKVRGMLWAWPAWPSNGGSLVLTGAGVLAQQREAAP